MQTEQLKLVIEAAILAAGEPVSLERLRDLFEESERPDKDEMRRALELLQTDYEQRGITLREIASGFCLQAKPEFAPWLKRLWPEKIPRYSRALLETLAIIAYKQPVTRGEIEDIRGVVVSSNIVKTLLDREWVKVVGEKEVPGRPSLYATTKQFLDHFNLKSLEELPLLEDITDIDKLAEQLEHQQPEIQITESSLSEDIETVEAIETAETLTQQDTIETEMALEEEKEVAI